MTTFDLDYPLTWGLTRKEIKDKLLSYPNKTINVEFFTGKVKAGKLTLTNFPGDCGALILQGANYATVEELKLAEYIASINGFSKIFATVVGLESYSVIEPAMNAFKKNRWITVAKGFSNRNKRKIDRVYVKYIRNCIYKGY